MTRSAALYFLEKSIAGSPPDAEKGPRNQHLVEGRSKKIPA